MNLLLPSLGCFGTTGFFGTCDEAVVGVSTNFPLPLSSLGLALEDAFFFDEKTLRSPESGLFSLDMTA